MHEELRFALRADARLGAIHTAAIRREAWRGSTPHRILNALRPALAEILPDDARPDKKRHRHAQGSNNPGVKTW